MSKIIYIGYAPLTYKVAEDFFISGLISDGVEVEYWDISVLFFSELPQFNVIEASWVKKITSITQLEQYINNNKAFEPTYFINFPYYGKVIKVFKILSKYNARICLIAKGAQPSQKVLATSFLNKLNVWLSFNKIKTTVQNRLCYLLKKGGSIKTFDRIYYAGQAALKIAGIGYEIDKQKAELIEIHSSDFDKSIAIQHEPPLIDGNYLVFLDEYIPFHPDFDMLKIKRIDANSYYASLNNLFSALEKKMGLQVVIAAHPKAEKYHTTNFFNNRSVYFNQTANLVKNASLVITHLSTSISFAVLFNKLVLLCFTNDMLKAIPLQINILHSFAESLGAPVINIDTDKVSEIELSTIDTNKYDKFKYEFLTSPNIAQLNSYQIFKESLQ